MRIEIVGVYPIEAKEPCHMVEIKIRDYVGELAMQDFTQELLDEPLENWQVPIDEYLLNETGREGDEAPFPGPINVAGHLRLAFFFYYLDLAKPLLTPVGNLPLPEPTDRPVRLNFIEHESPY